MRACVCVCVCTEMKNCDVLMMHQQKHCVSTGHSRDTDNCFSYLSPQCLFCGNSHSPCSACMSNGICFSEEVLKFSASLSAICREQDLCVWLGVKGTEYTIWVHRISGPLHSTQSHSRWFITRPVIRLTWLSSAPDYRYILVSVEHGNKVL